MVCIAIYLSEQRELKASPRKPNVCSLVKSEKSLSFDVWYFKATKNFF